MIIIINNIDYNFHLEKKSQEIILKMQSSPFCRNYPDTADISVK